MGGYVDSLVKQVGRGLIDWKAHFSAADIINAANAGVLAIPAPKANQVVMPDFENIFVHFKAGQKPFSSPGPLIGFWGVTGDFNAGDISQIIDLDNLANEIVRGTAPSSPIVADPVDLAGLGFYLSLDISGTPLGPIKTFSLLTGGNNGINTFSLGTDKGLLYAVNDTITDSTGDGNSIFMVTSIGAGGTVTGLVELFAGTGYSAGADHATSTDGSGTGFQINALTIGGGFRVGDIPVDQSNGNGLATFLVNAVDSNGNITSLTLIDGGMSYQISSSDPLNVNPSGGTNGFGTGATISVNSLVFGDGTMDVLIPFRIIDL